MSNSKSLSVNFRT